MWKSCDLTTRKKETGEANLNSDLMFTFGNLSLGKYDYICGTPLQNHRKVL